MAKRHERTHARRCALQVLYTSEIQGAYPSVVASSERFLSEDGDLPDYAQKLIEGVEAHQIEIDRMLTSTSENWALARMPIVDRSILRLATFETVSYTHLDVYKRQRLRSAYETLRRANEQVERALRPGVTGKEMHELAERVLDEGGFGGLMGHGLGHGVGLDIHELPNLSPRNEAPLVAGNVVTVEPGIYVPGEFGMRLEDFGVVTEEGFQVFTQSTHDMVII